MFSFFIIYIFKFFFIDLIFFKWSWNYAYTILSLISRNILGHVCPIKFHIYKTQLSHLKYCLKYSCYYWSLVAIYDVIKLWQLFPAVYFTVLFYIFMYILRERKYLITHFLFKDRKQRNGWPRGGKKTQNYLQLA